MARKETPDILGQILSDTAPTAPGPIQAPEPALQPARSKARTRRKPVSQPAAATTPVDLPEWEYLIISFQGYHGWRPRYINGREVRDWMKAPLIHEYVEQLGEDGWELAAASAGKSLYGRTDQHQLYFKRQKR